MLIGVEWVLKMIEWMSRSTGLAGNEGELCRLQSVWLEVCDPGYTKYDIVDTGNKTDSTGGSGYKGSGVAFMVGNDEQVRQDRRCRRYHPQYHHGHPDQADQFRSKA
jgi:hypothetical protein